MNKKRRKEVFIIMSLTIRRLCHIKNRKTIHHQKVTQIKSNKCYPPLYKYQYLTFKNKEIKHKPLI